MHKTSSRYVVFLACLVDRISCSTARFTSGIGRSDFVRVHGNSSHVSARPSKCREVPMCPSKVPFLASYSPPRHHVGSTDRVFHPRPWSDASTSWWVDTSFVSSSPWMDASSFVRVVLSPEGGSKSPAPGRPVGDDRRRDGVAAPSASWRGSQRVQHTHSSASYVSRVVVLQNEQARVGRRVRTPLGSRARTRRRPWRRNGHRGILHPFSPSQCGSGLCGGSHLASIPRASTTNGFDATHASRACARDMEPSGDPRAKRKREGDAKANHRGGRGGRAGKRGRPKQRVVEGEPNQDPHERCNADEYVHRMLVDVLLVNVSEEKQPSHAGTSQGDTKVYLPRLAEELDQERMGKVDEEKKAELHIRNVHVETAMMERILRVGIDGDGKLQGVENARNQAWKYLHDCWVRAQEVERELEPNQAVDDGKERRRSKRKKRNEPHIEQAQKGLEEIKLLAARLGGALLIEPTVFTGNSKLEELCITLLDGTVHDPNFLREVYRELEHQGEMRRVMDPNFSALRRKMKDMCVSAKNQESYMAALKLLCNQRTLPCLVEHQQFLPRPGTSLREIERGTFLGPLFRFSSCSSSDPKAPDAFASSGPDFSRAKVEIISRSIRNSIRDVQMVQVDVLRDLMNPTTRDKAVQWLDRTLLAGTESRKHFPDQSKLCSSGFAINLTHSLLVLNNEFLSNRPRRCADLSLDVLCQKPGSFFPGGPLLNEEGTYAAGELAQAFCTWESIPTHEVLFLCALRAFHCFLTPLSGRHEMLAQQILRSQSMPTFDPVHNRWLESEMHTNLAQKFAVDAHLCDPGFIYQVVHFAVFVGLKLLETARAGFTCTCGNGRFSYAYNAMNSVASSCVCLPTEDPEGCRGLPQYVLGDVCEVLLWVCKFVPNSLTNSYIGPSVVAFAGAFLSSPAFVQSVHLRARLGDMLFELFGRRRDINKIGISILSLDNLAVGGLADGLVSLYVDAGRTGVSSTELHRYKIARLVQRCWKVLFGGKDVKVNIPDCNRDIYRKFAHAVLNEYCLMHDTWVHLCELREMRSVLLNQNDGESQNTLMQALNETQIAALEDRTYDCFRLASEMVKMMCYWSVVIPGVFLEECFIQRVSDVLNSTLNTLIKLHPDDVLDKKSTREAIMKTRRSLKDVLKTYLNFAVANPDFSKAVVESGLYEEDMFSKGLDALKSSKRVDDSDKLYSCVKRFSLTLSEVGSSGQDVEESDDVPDEFLDPVMQVVMTEPVMLPSNNVLDRKTILQHLMNTPSDPFTREPLTIESCKPLPKLQQRIHAYLQSRNKM
mmetsp:Transcript_4918/g.31454  ORF Transcript_4918/g.31454 Transcript_4918/m.31454 type:complete len:1286 (-) Transcript_4918:321-4178(-)